MSDLLQLAQIACEAATAAGADQADASAGRGHDIGVEIERDRIKSSDGRWTGGVSVRAFFRGGVGWANAAKLEPEAAQDAGRRAAEMARVAEPDPDFVSLPEGDGAPEVEGLFDERVAELTVDQFVEWCLGHVDEAKQVAPDAVVSGGGGAGWHEGAIANSLGVGESSRRTSVGLSTFVIIKRGDDVGSYYDFDQARVLGDLEPTGIGSRAAAEAVRFLGARHVPTTTLPVVLGPLASFSLIRGLCADANAEDIQRKRSYLVGKRGELIASELLTITDEPFIPRGMGSARYDGEGFPHQPLTVVQNGVLATYLHNSYTANKGGEPNTGHSTRGGISPTNTIPKLGEAAAAEIIADTSEGIYLDATGISPNSVTGEISATVDFGFKIENGKLAYPVKSTLLGINMLELLQNIDAISSDYREEPGMIMPTIRAHGVRVAGAE